MAGQIDGILHCLQKVRMFLLRRYEWSFSRFERIIGQHLFDQTILVDQNHTTLDEGGENAMN